MDSHVFPASSVLAIVRHGPDVQYAMPSTKPTFAETKVADSGSNPDGRGSPAGAEIAAAVVVVEEVVVEDWPDGDVVVDVVGDADLEEVNLKPAMAAMMMIRTTAPIEAISIFLCLLMISSKKFHMSVSGN